MSDTGSAKDPSRRTGPALQTLLDAAAWTAALAFVLLLTADFAPSGMASRDVITWIALALGLHFVLGSALYRGRYVVGSFEEARALATTVLLVALSLQAIHLVAPFGAPARPLLSGSALALVAMVTMRGLRRLQAETTRRPGEGERVLVMGAGVAGSELVRQIVRDPAGAFVPVGIIEDDPGKRNLRVNGVPVLGDRSRIAQAAAQHNASAIVLAVAGADAALIRAIDEIAIEAGLKLLVLPPLKELVGRHVEVSDIREVDEVDLMGRHVVDTDVAAVADYLRGKRILVTGAGGSIGSELCRQIVNHGPAELIMLDRDESALHGVQLSIRGRALLDTRETVLADIREPDTVRRIFLDRRPEVVFHAAALKHLPMLEGHPAEAFKSNILGTLNVLEAAREAGTERFVNISTDKAANPSSVLGYSKRVAERLTAWAAEQTGQPYLSVRFGNVLGSRGSVLHAFGAQIEAGGPVTVTDPEVTRFFMTVAEACELVVQAGAIGRPGEVLVLDMGEPVRIADVAAQLIAQSGRQIDIEYTGLRQGEKLHEELFGASEVDSRPVHPLISHVDVPLLDPQDLTESASDDATAVENMRTLSTGRQRMDPIVGAAAESVTSR